MSNSRISKSLREFVRERAQDRCEYCASPTWLTGQLHEIDHIMPRALGGTNDPDNLCLACASCNGQKHDDIAAIDPLTNTQVTLFNPRQHHWRDHFEWSADGLSMVGITPIGRATVTLLEVNHPLLMSARSFWVELGVHPPD